jgi:hypothetical protein
MPFSRSMAASQPQTAFFAALPQSLSGVPPCHAHASSPALRGHSAADSRSMWKLWGGRRAVAVPPLQPQHVRRWRGIAAMAKGGKQQKRKQDDSE